MTGAPNSGGYLNIEFVEYLLLLFVGIVISHAIVHPIVFLVLMQKLRGHE